MFGRKRCLAHLHGQTSGSPAMDTIYGGVLALSEFIRDDYLQNSSLDRRSAYILYNCIDTERFRPAPPPMALRPAGTLASSFVMLFCGRLEPDKGIHKLMEALSKLPVPNIRLLIVGSPFFGRTQQSSFLRKLEQQAKALGDRVQFTGYIPNEDLADYYRLADLVCVPTLVEEAAGLVAMEAMACGRPVLATRSGGMPEYLEGSQAVLVERGENIADQLAWSIRMLYEHPALCAEMGAAGASGHRIFLLHVTMMNCAHCERDRTERRDAMSKAAICVVVPVYKAMATLDRCVESVLAQQVEGGLTCILVDDGSPDESGALCDVWAAKDGRVTVIHQDDLGVSGARNSGLAAADSEFIVFLDSDDALRPGALQAALTAQRAAPQDFVVWHYTTIEKDPAAVTADAEPRAPSKALPGCGWTACWLCPGTSCTGPDLAKLNCSLMYSTPWARTCSLCWITSPCWGRRCRSSATG